MLPNHTHSRPDYADDYKLQRGPVASTRLNAQHYLWKDTVGSNIEAAIPVVNHHDYRIADVGTGTGVWLLDVKRKYPDIIVDGFDVSLDQAPSAALMPAGTSVRQLDATKPPPDELVGRYDLVHVRLFLTVVSNNDPQPILRNLMAMLKPGGWLQWGDHDLADINSISPNHGLDDSAMARLVEIMRGQSLGKWVANLDREMSAVGFQDTHTTKYPVGVDHRFFWTQMQFVVILEFFSSQRSEASDAVIEIVSRAITEARHGVTFEFAPVVTVGRKCP